MEVTVHDGIVTLVGTVERKSLVPTVEGMCRSPDGVVAVRTSTAARSRLVQRPVAGNPSRPPVVATARQSSTQPAPLTRAGARSGCGCSMTGMRLE
ncbi:BON domain-containing protein [Kitasatospora sp. NPDC087314]|uniref:BON domain-containing protein n=1 Tax=Kitasatospora sp. NPDC087314 TaxID=3364068 RepID=UPI003825505F